MNERISYPRFWLHSVLLIFMAVISVGIIGTATAFAASENPVNWHHSKSKTATNLNKDFNSTVTLSVPSAETTLVSDMVFVLDKSTSPSLEDQLLASLKDLNSNIKSSGARVNVGIIIFNKNANEELPLTELNDENYPKIEKAVKTELSSGTNLHAGILAGTEMLDNDTQVDASNKYLVVVSDGITYMYGKTPTAINLNNGESAKGFAGPDNWETKYGTKEITKTWPTYLNDVKSQIDKDGDKYDVPYNTELETTFIPYDERTDHAMSVDKALYKSYSAYVDATAKYHTYAVDAKTQHENNYPWGPSFIRYLNDDISGNPDNTSFTQIEKAVYYVVDAGSTITDTMGSGKDDKGNDYNFDFVNDLDRININFDGKNLDKKALGNNSYGFGADKEINGGYKFILTYDNNSDSFTVKANVPITLSSNMKVTYDVHLTNPQTVKGEYGKYDIDGNNEYDSLHTNERAVLHYVDSSGKEGDEEFGRPTVSYTVEQAAPVDPDHHDNKTTTTTTVKEDTNSPKTNDDTNMLNYLFVIIAASAGAVLILRKLRSSK